VVIAPLVAPKQVVLIGVGEMFICDKDVRVIEADAVHPALEVAITV
jgi:hypothetical protein